VQPACFCPVKNFFIIKKPRKERRDCLKEKDTQPKIGGLFSLVEYLNKSRLDGLNEEIALFFFEERKNLGKLSLQELSQKGYYSQASLSRFLKNCAKSNYQQFKLNMSTSLESSKAYCNSIHACSKDMSIAQIKDDLIHKQLDNLSLLKQLDEEEIFAAASELTKHKNVYFLGSELSLAMCASLQNALNTYDQNAYCFFDYHGQEEAMARVQKEDLVICISIKERWYSADFSADTLQKFKRSACTKILWTCMERHIEEEEFDSVFRFGSNINELGYNHLLNIIPILTRTYLRLQNDENFYNTH
jgi:DNA-binding MurR/RpiR family transcriptional regulator